MGVLTVCRLADASWLGVLVCATLPARPLEPGSGRVRKTLGSQRWAAVIGLVSGGTIVKRVSWNHASNLRNGGTSGPGKELTPCAWQKRVQSRQPRDQVARRSVCNNHFTPSRPLHRPPI